jgi:hypothetical protein
MKLIKETIEEVKYLTEDVGGVKTLFIQGPFLVSEKANRNGRIYARNLLEREVKRYNEEYVNKNRAFGELGHPETPAIGLERVSHLITNLRQNGNVFEGKAKILDTPMGRIAKGIIEGGGLLGVSSRGMGSLKAINGINHVQEDFYLATAADIVADPSAPGAFVEGIMEGKEWVWDNGIVKEADVNYLQQTIKKARAKQLEEVKLRAFENFISKL